ncbi:MAG: phosphomannomutase/phosphoglucomutase [Rickettsiales bacterium]|jgi:phosphomannomutase|nr:phosphomannomutase/phosphoglucomutase [Rickettsiales bacterium]
MLDSHVFDESILRQYDIRGVVDRTLGIRDAYYVGRSFGTLLRRKYGKKTCVVGYDGRHSSESYAERLIEGLGLCGIDTINIGLAPTPMVCFAVQFLKKDAGVIVTASHNPSEYNGFKMLTNTDPVWGEDIQQLNLYSRAGDFENARGYRSSVNVREDYLNFIVKTLDNGESKLKIAWDAANGAMASIIKDVVAKFPGKHITICDTVDGNFPNHSPDPSIEKNLQMLKNEVITNGCDLGIGFDGDGDRIGVIDDEGTFLYGDQLLAILAREFLRKNPGEKVMSEVKASKVLYDDIVNHGGIPVMWKAGHSMQKAKMKSDDIKLAGETSGHIFYGDNHDYDDALYAAVKLMSFLSQNSVKLSSIVKAFPKTYSTTEIRIKADDRRKFEVVEEITDRMKKDGRKFINIDGLRVETEDGWWLARASNTLPEITTRCESLSKKGFDLCKAELKKQLKESGFDVDFD